MPQLRSASDFADSIGINAHVGYAWPGYDNAALVSTSLKYLGVDTVRDALTPFPDALPNLLALAASGVKFDFIVSSGVSNAAEIAGFAKDLAAFQTAHPGSIVAVEGLNEANHQSFSYDGSSSMSAAASFQKALYAAVKGQAALSGVAVYNLTLGHNDAGDYAALGNLSGVSDYAAAHSYVSTNTTVDAALDVSLGLANAAASGRPTVITETGHTTLASTADVGANETVQAKSILNTLVTAFQDGVEMTYLYELLDRGGDPTNTNAEAHFGLFKVDGSPKIAATAVHNLTTILADPGTGGATPTADLGYTLGGLPSNGGSMVLAKSNGAYDLVVWNAPRLWNDATDTEISNPDQPVQLHLDGVAGLVSVYDPMKGSSPIATYHNVQDIVLPISDHPLIVEIGGTGRLMKESVETPPHVTGTAASIVAQIGTLKDSTTLLSITLSDDNVLPVSSIATMQYMIANQGAVLSKIVGGYEFSITQAAPTWQKTDVFDAKGTLVSTTDAGLRDGQIFTQQTRFVNGTVDTVNFSDGVKTTRYVDHNDGSHEAYTFGITGHDYATEHYVVGVSGALVSFERLHADGTLSFTEIHSGGDKIVSWYGAGGVIAKKAVYGGNGDLSTSTFENGVKTALYVTAANGERTTVAYASNGERTLEAVYGTDGAVSTTTFENGTVSRVYALHADRSQDNTAYGITGQAFAIELQKLDASGRVYEIVRSHADGTPQYRELHRTDGSSAYVSYDEAGRKVASVEVAADGSSVTDHFGATDLLTQEVVQRPGFHSTTEFTDGVKSALSVVNGDGSRHTATYAANGDRTLEAFYGTDGSATTTTFVNGQVSRVYALHADGSQDNTAYGITGRSYVTEFQKLDATGHVYEVVRSHQDGSLDYHAVTRPDGSQTTTTFDAAGLKLAAVTVAADGSSVADYFAATGLLAKEVVQGSGFTSTTEFTDGAMSALYVVNHDGTRQTVTYEANGNKSLEALYGADGSVTTTVYRAGAPSQVYAAHADGSQDNTLYGIQGQAYTTELQKLDAAGRTYEIVRSHADGSLQYHELHGSDGSSEYLSYDAAGRKVSAVTVASDGGSLSETFDGPSGLHVQTVLKTAGGDVMTANFAGGIPTSLYEAHADGLSRGKLFDGAGSLSSDTILDGHGYQSVSLYSGGALHAKYLTFADGTSESFAYGITGQSYASEHQKSDASGSVHEVTRSHADGSLDFHFVATGGGGSATSYYDASGVKTLDYVRNADSSLDVFNFAVADQPGVVRHEAYTSSNALKLVDTTKADGTHDIFVANSGLTVSAGSGNDVVNMYGGGNAFAFGGGQDIVKNFHWNEAAAGHDVLQISKSMAAGYGSLSVAQVGWDTVVTVGGHGSVVLESVQAANISAHDFLFV